MKNSNLFLLISISLLIISCSDKFDSDKNNDTLKSSSQPTVWQEQLEYAKKRTETKNKEGSNELYLIGYTHKGKINNIDEVYEVVEQLFSENSVIAQSVSCSNFEIIPIKTILKRAKSIGNNNPFKNIKHQLITTVLPKMELLELEWMYKGNTYYSTAIVADGHNGGVIYDNIGFITLDPNSRKSGTSNITITPKEIIVDVIKRFTKFDSGKNLFGQIVYTYLITCSSTFDTNGVLRNRSLNAEFDSAKGWSCTADVKTIGGKINSSDYHEFSWGYAYSSTASVTLGWNGSGFTLPGGTKGGIGTVVHKP